MFFFTYLVCMMRSPLSSFDLIEHYMRKRMDGGADEDGSEGRVWRKSGEGTLRDWKCRTDRRTDEEESKGGGRGQGSLARSHAPSLSRPPDRLYANRNRRLARSVVRLATGGGRKVLKQGKECPRQWRGRPRPPTAAGQRRIYLGAATAFAASAASSFFSFLGREMAAPKDHL